MIVIEDFEIQQYKNIIIQLARNLTSDRELQKDLIQEGYIGLLNAKKNFNPKYEVKFLTYAYPYIKSAMLRYYNKNKKEMGISLNDELDFSNDLEDIHINCINDCLVDCSDEVQKIIHYIVDDGLTIREIAKKMGYTKSKVSYMLSKEREKIYKRIKKKDF